MEIKSFKFNDRLRKNFIEFVYQLYEEDKNWIPPIREQVVKQLSPDFHFYNKPGNDFQHFLAISGNKMVGRVSAFVNKDLTDKENCQIGTIGFFESIENYDVAKKLLDSAINWLRENHNIQKVWGPMNFDIWHGYRFMTNGYELGQFVTEPYNKNYYAEYFLKYGFKEKQLWNSVEVEGTEKIERMISRGAVHYEKLKNRGYRFESVNLSELKSVIQKLYPALTSSFSKFLGYTPVSSKIFESLFLPYKSMLRSELFTLVYDENSKLAGFIVAFLDFSAAVKSMKGQNTLFSNLRFLFNKRKAKRIIIYLGGITPDEATKKAGLGRAGFYHIIRQALNLGYKKLIIAVMAQRNVVRGHLGGKGSKAQREYSLFEIC